MGRGDWIQTIHGRGWFVLLRLYCPLEPFFDKTWQPSEGEVASRASVSSWRHQRRVQRKEGDSC